MSWYDIGRASIQLPSETPCKRCATRGSSTVKGAKADPTTDREKRDRDAYMQLPITVSWDHAIELARRVSLAPTA